MVKKGRRGPNLFPYLDDPFNFLAHLAFSGHGWTGKVAWPSGLRRWIKAPVSSGAWVRIPPLPSFRFFIFIFCKTKMRQQGRFLTFMISLRFLTQEAVDCHLSTGMFHLLFCLLSRREVQPPFRTVLEYAGHKGCCGFSNSSKTNKK